jgi:long-chain fatty acid adenylyltransferase FadD28
VAIAVPDEGPDKLVAIIELKKRGDDSHEDAIEEFAVVEREVTSTISTSRGLSVADLAPVPPGSFPIRTPGKVRSSACVEQYRQA